MLSRNSLFYTAPMTKINFSPTIELGASNTALTVNLGLRTAKWAWQGFRAAALAWMFLGGAMALKQIVRGPGDTSEEIKQAC